MEREESFRAPASPGAMAYFEQQHALALDRLRTTKTYYLACVDERDDGKVDCLVVAGTCVSPEMGERLLNLIVNHITETAESLAQPLRDDELDEPEAA